MRVKLNDNTWAVVRLDMGPRIRGQIDPPGSVDGRLKLSTRLRSNKEIMEVFIHECLHGCFWHLDEDSVDRAAKDISRALHRLGARVNISEIKVKSKRKSQ
jgi:hypothetical protein